MTVETATAWIHLAHFDGNGYFAAREFDTSVVIFRAVLRGSLTATVINGVTETASFTAPDGRYRYNELLRQVAELTAGEPAFWCYVANPDNALSILEWVRECRYVADADAVLSTFETNPAVQGGVSHLGLFGSSGRWWLAHDYEPSEAFTITLHGPDCLCGEVSRRLRCTGG